MKELKWYISDDEKKQGTQAEVEAYEAALTPLAKFGLPWSVSDAGNFTKKDGGYPWGNTKHNRQLVALLNLMPLVEELRQVFMKAGVRPDWRTHQLFNHHNDATKNLLLAYEKALGIEQPS